MVGWVDRNTDGREEDTCRHENVYNSWMGGRKHRQTDERTPTFIDILQKLKLISDVILL